MNELNTKKPSYYERNREKVKARSRKYHKEHLEEIKARKKDYYKKNKEHIKKKSAEYAMNSKNRDKINKNSRKNRVKVNKHKEILSTANYNNLSGKQRQSMVGMKLGMNPNPQKNNSLGIKNISYDNIHNKYRYSKMIKGQMHVVSFDTIEEAIQHKEWFEETHFTKEQKELAKKLGEING